MRGNLQLYLEESKEQLFYRILTLSRSVSTTIANSFACSPTEINLKMIAPLLLSDSLLLVRGLLVNPKDSADLANKILCLYRNPD